MIIGFFCIFLLHTIKENNRPKVCNVHSNINIKCYWWRGENIIYTCTSQRQRYGKKKKCSRHLYTCLETFDSLIMLFHYTNFYFFLSLLVQHNTFCQFWKVRRRKFLVKVKVFCGVSVWNVTPYCSTWY